MSDGLGRIGIGAGGATPATGLSRVAGEPAGGGFADVLKGQIEEVVRLQQDASRAVENLALGRTDDVVGVMTAMEKAGIAFNTLLAIRGKLMEAYNEVRNIPL